jgi:hypothetical protein
VPSASTARYAKANAHAAREAKRAAVRGDELARELRPAEERVREAER